MDKGGCSEEAGDPLSLLPPPSITPPNLIPDLIESTLNHFENLPDAIYYQYTVSFTSEDKTAVERKGIGRKVIDKLYQTYASELAGKQLAYDGEKSLLYTAGPLPQNKLEFTLVLEETFSKRDDESPCFHGSPCRTGKRAFQSKTFTVRISHAQDAPRVLDVVLMQQAANRRCLLGWHLFSHDDILKSSDVGGGVTGCRGLHSSFRTTQGDVSTTLILKPGPVIDFLIDNQNVREHRDIDWQRAKKMLKNLRVMTTHSSMEFKINGLSDKPCNQQYFPLKVRNGGSPKDKEQIMEITVLDYFQNHRHIKLTYSAYLPCLNVGKPKRPNYLPLELCSLISLQRYTTKKERAFLDEKARKKRCKYSASADAEYYLRNYRYKDPGLLVWGVSNRKDKQLVQVEGRDPKAVTLYRCDENPGLAAWGVRTDKQLAEVEGRGLKAGALYRCDEDLGSAWAVSRDKQLVEVEGRVPKVNIDFISIEE